MKNFLSYFPKAKSLPGEALAKSGYKLKAGFTLIELLVVIAIIGILSGIVLASLGTARNKAKQASAISSLSSMRAQAELSLGATGTYPSGLCTATGSGGIGDLMTAVDGILGAANTECAVAANGLTWAAAADVDLSSGGVSVYCVDSSGNATTTGAATPDAEVLLSGEASPVCDGNAS